MNEKITLVKEELTNMFTGELDKDSIVELFSLVTTVIGSTEPSIEDIKNFFFLSMIRTELFEVDERYAVDVTTGNVLIHNDGYSIISDSNFEHINVIGIDKDTDEYTVAIKNVIDNDKDIIIEVFVKTIERYSND